MFLFVLPTIVGAIYGLIWYKDYYDENIGRYKKKKKDDPFS